MMGDISPETCREHIKVKYIIILLHQAGVDKIKIRVTSVQTNQNFTDVSVSNWNYIIPLEKAASVV